MRTIPRWLFAIAMCCAVLGLTLPARAVAQPVAKQTIGCCAKMAGQEQSDSHCRHNGAASEDDHCCAACAIGLSLIITPAARFIFSQSRGQQFVIGGVAEAPRLERPPVPPPRAKLS